MDFSGWLWARLWSSQGEEICGPVRFHVGGAPVLTVTHAGLENDAALKPALEGAKCCSPLVGVADLLAGPAADRLDSLVKGFFHPQLCGSLWVATGSAQGLGWAPGLFARDALVAAGRNYMLMQR